jgi:ectoine hydroxylase-related dioxygenase (phytanoyl-CoA dioxygenase family)
MSSADDIILDWESFDRDGYIVLKNVCSAADLSALNARVDDLMDGKVRYDDLLMQLDPTGGSAPADYASAGTEVVGQTACFKGASRSYRKIGEAHAGLEVDPLFRAFMCRPLFRRICARVYGAHAGISVYRAMVMAKPAGSLGGGTPLPWHQDGGDWWTLDRDPLCFVWCALSRATHANGAVQVVRGSHHAGLLSRRGHTLADADIERLVDADGGKNVVTVELEAGDAFLAHNWLVHRSGVNTTEEARRGFSANFVDARTRVTDPRLPGAGSIGITGQTFPLLWERR